MSAPGHDTIVLGTHGFYGVKCSCGWESHAVYATVDAAEIGHDEHVLALPEEEVR